MELNPLLSVCTQGSISGFALIPPWAVQEYRAYGTHNTPKLRMPDGLSVFNFEVIKDCFIMVLCSEASV